MHQRILTFANDVCIVKGPVFSQVNPQVTLRKPLLSLHCYFFPRPDELGWKAVIVLNVNNLYYSQKL